jgi:hypothetical protein
VSRQHQILYFGARRLDSSGFTKYSVPRICSDAIVASSFQTAGSPSLTFFKTRSVLPRRFGVYSNLLQQEVEIFTPRLLVPLNLLWNAVHYLCFTIRTHRAGGLIRATHLRCPGSLYSHKLSDISEGTLWTRFLSPLPGRLQFHRQSSGELVECLKFWLQIMVGHRRFMRRPEKAGYNLWP